MAGVRVRECSDRRGGMEGWRRGGEIIISPPSVNKPTPHYQCMREGCGEEEEMETVCTHILILSLPEISGRT